VSGVGRLGQQDLGVDRLEGRDHDGIEVRASMPLDLFERTLDRPGILVRARMRQRVEDVDDRDDPPGERDLVACQSLELAAAVPALVMGQRDLGRHMEEGL
jgi:hypothetical protein